MIYFISIAGCVIATEWVLARCMTRTYGLGYADTYVLLLPSESDDTTHGGVAGVSANERDLSRESGQFHLLFPSASFLERAPASCVNGHTSCLDVPSKVVPLNTDGTFVFTNSACHWIRHPFVFDIECLAFLPMTGRSTASPNSQNGSPMSRARQ